jgi:hypothetical protein
METATGFVVALQPNAATPVTLVTSWTSLVEHRGSWTPVAMPLPSAVALPEG